MHISEMPAPIAWKYLRGCKAMEGNIHHACHPFTWKLNLGHNLQATPPYFKTRLGKKFQNRTVALAMAKQTTNIGLLLNFAVDIF